MPKACLLHTSSPDFAFPLAYLRHKEVRYLPRRKVAAPLRLVPIHDILVVPFAPFLRCIAIIAAEPTHANRYVYRPRG